MRTHRLVRGGLQLAHQVRHEVVVEGVRLFERQRGQVLRRQHLLDEGVVPAMVG